MSLNKILSDTFLLKIITFSEIIGKHRQCGQAVMPNVANEYFAMQKVAEVTIVNFSALKWSQSLTRRLAGNRGSTKESAFRMYLFRVL